MGSEVDKKFIEPYDFLYYFSPTIPYNFPAERVPKNLCEEQLLSTMKCYGDHPKASDEIKRGTDCARFASEFNECKRRRDSIMFREIQDWETDNFKGLRIENKKTYLRDLQEERSGLQNTFENLPASENSAEKRWRIYTDLLQTKWRINYLEQLI